MNTNSKSAELLLDYLNGRLSVEELLELERQLKVDHDLRRQLLEISVDESALTDWAESESESATLDDCIFQDSKLRPNTSDSNSELSRLHVGWWAIAAILVVGFSVALWRFLQPADASVSAVALLVASIDAEWADEKVAANTSLKKGAYHLKAGKVELFFSEGARVSMVGPAAFELKNAHHLHIKQGQMVAQIADEALGFIVTSPQSEVIDLGTEFGLSIDGKGQTDVHVIDGLVEVLSNELNESVESVTIPQGQARRFKQGEGNLPNEIPVQSREEILHWAKSRRIGLQMLRGSVRISRSLSKDDLFKTGVGNNWIDLIPEKQKVVLNDEIEVSINSTGNYRDFEKLAENLSTETLLDSYLLHFRPGSPEQVRGVIRFDQPVVAILCTGHHLNGADSIFGISSVHYPIGNNSFRGLEPNGRQTSLNARVTDPDWLPDEITLSQDRHTISIRAFANTERGYDQVRVLVASKPVQN